MTYRAGELDQRAIVQRKQRVEDGLGGDVVTLVDVGEYWCHVRPSSGREVTQFDRVNAETGYLFVFRNGLDVNAEDTLFWQGESFNIKAIRLPKGRSLYVEINAETGVAL
jgi:SPP1 family predicted phage head-tail adaptor